MHTWSITLIFYEKEGLARGNKENSNETEKHGAFNNSDAQMPHKQKYLSEHREICVSQ
jgi:hypothetical protein